MSTNNLQPKPVSRRDFLKLGCLGGATIGAAVCGAAGLAPVEAPVDLPSFTYGENSMKAKILVAYASAMGSTAEVADALGKELAASGFAVDVRPVTEQPTVEGYQAVVVGSAVQYGKWLPEAVDFLRSNQEALQQVPVALFCVHITHREDDPATRRIRLSYLDEARALVRPAAEAFFAGKFDRRGAALLMPGLFARFIPAFDLRNWPAIRAWATQTLTAQISG